MEISFYNFCNTKLCTKHGKTCEFHLYCWDHVCNVIEWCLVDCFHCEFGVSTQIMLHDYCNMKCKTFPACDRLLMALWSNFFSLFKIFTLIRTLMYIYNQELIYIQVPVSRIGFVRKRVLLYYYVITFCYSTRSVSGKVAKF